MYNQTAKIFKEKKRSNFSRETKLNKPTKKGVKQYPKGGGPMFPNMDNKGPNSMFKKDNNAPTAYTSKSGLFNKSMAAISGMGDNSPFKNKENPSSLFKSSKGFPGSGPTTNNNVFPTRKEGTSSIFSKTGSTYGSESPKKYSSGLFPSKDNINNSMYQRDNNNPFLKDNNASFKKDNPSFTSNTPSWSKPTTTGGSIFQTKTNMYNSPSRTSTTNLFQPKSTLGVSSPLQKKETTNLFLDKQSPSFTKMYSLTQGPSENKPDQMSEQKQRDAFNLMTNLLKNPFEREKNKEMLQQYKQSYAKSEAVRMKEIQEILKNPYQLPKNTATLSTHRTATAPKPVHRSFPQSYLCTDLKLKRNRNDYLKEENPDHKQKEENKETYHSTLLLDLEEYNQEPPTENAAPCNSIAQHKLPKSEKYQTLPSRQELQLMSESELQQVENFYVISPYGNVHFLQPVDVRGLNLDRIILFESDNFQIYPDQDAPMKGQGLNVAFDLTVLLGPEAQALKQEEIMRWVEEVAYENDFQVQKVANDCVVFRRLQ